MKWVPLPALILIVTALSWAQDLEQDPIIIRAEQGAPKTLYIAPWQRAGEPLEPAPVQGGWRDNARPLDRQTFLRELELQRQGYYVDRPSQPPMSSPVDPPSGDAH